MSLTGLLRSSGPLRDWFGLRFPATRGLATDTNQALRGGPRTTACVITPAAGSDGAFVGTAVGYVLTAHLQPRALTPSMATGAAARLAEFKRTAYAAAIEREVVDRIRALQPHERELRASEWAELCRLTLVLARFEQFRRSVSVAGLVLGPLVRCGGDVHELARLVATEPTVTDLVALGQAAVEDYAGLRDSEQLHMAPEFMQSDALGGADADIIYDGTLLDFKSTAGAGVVRRRDFWQLLGYLLADTDDRYRIRHVGFAALRWRREVFWPVEEYLTALSGSTTPPLHQLRLEFSELLAALRSGVHHARGRRPGASASA